MTAAAPVRTCLSIAEAARFATTDPEADQSSVLAHIDDCERCRRLVAEAVRGSRPEAAGPGSGTCSPGEILSDRYQIVAPIGAGGMGEVYEARDRLLGDTVALKTLVCTALDDEAAIARLKREVLLARKVTHENVCRILEFGVHTRAGSRESVPFFTMELLRGETLGVRLRRPGAALAPAEARALALQMVEGLGAVHAAGIVHRDLKPENVFLVRRSAGDTRAVIMDLGLARPVRVSSEMVTMSTGVGVAGTVGYMAPEQRRGEPPTVASDIYSLGLVLQEMLGSSAEWHAIIARCLAPLPVHRFRDVRELRRALGAGARRRTGRIAVAAGLLAAAAGALVIVWPGEEHRPALPAAVTPAPTPTLAPPPPAPPASVPVPAAPAVVALAPIPNPPRTPPRKVKARAQAPAPAGPAEAPAPATPAAAERPLAEPAPEKKRAIVFKPF
jgi:serine/threonine-protein kinase